MRSVPLGFLTIAGIGIATILGASSAAAQSVEDFYKKTHINLVVSTATGGGYDNYARVFGRAFPRYVPGNPNVVIQNMPGAGGLRATNHMYNAAPKDGTVIALVHTSMVTAPLFGVAQANFDARKFSYLGNIAKEPNFCVSWAASPIKTFDQILAKEEFIVGAAGAGGTIETVPIIMNNLLGTNIKVIGGYPSGTAVLLAMERGELHGRCGWSMSSMMGSHPHWFKEKKIIVVVQTALAKHPDLPDAPLIMDYAKTDEQRQVMELIFAQQEVSRPVLAPPDIPKDRLEALRQAFQATMKDPGFVAEAEKQGLDVLPGTAADIDALLNRLYSMPEPTVKKALEVSTK